MNDEQSSKKARSYLPKTIKTINQFYGRYREKGAKTETERKETNKENRRKRVAKSSKRGKSNDSRNQRREENFAKNRRRSYNQSGSESSGLSNRYVHKELYRPSDRVGRNQRTRLGNRSRNVRTRRTFSSSIRKKRDQPKGFLNETVMTNYHTGMSFMQPTTKSIKGSYRDRGGSKSDGCIVQGSEYLTSVSVETTDSTVGPTQPGDVLKVFFMNPLYMIGTRIRELALLYEHYKFLEACIEFVPDISALQNGTLGAAFDYDPDEPINLVVDPDERRRLFMALKGANIARVIGYLRAYLQMDEDTLKDYFIHPHDEARSEMQAYFLLMAFSTFSPPSTGVETLNLGTLILHYKIKLDVRHLDPIPPPISAVEWMISALPATIFTAVTQGSTISIKETFYSLSFGSSAIKPSMIVVFTVVVAMQQTGPVYLVCDGTEGYQFRFLSQGSCWFGFVTAVDGPLYITTDVDAAIDKSTNDCVTWNSGPAAVLTTAILHSEIFDLGELDTLTSTMDEVRKWRMDREDKIKRLRKIEMEYRKITYHDAKIYISDPSAPIITDVGEFDNILTHEEEKRLKETYLETVEKELSELNAKLPESILDSEDLPEYIDPGIIPIKLPILTDNDVENHNKLYIYNQKRRDFYYEFIFNICKKEGMEPEFDFMDAQTYAAQGTSEKYEDMVSYLKLLGCNVLPLEDKLYVPRYIKQEKDPS